VGALLYAALEGLRKAGGFQEEALERIQSWCALVSSVLGCRSLMVAST